MQMIRTSLLLPAVMHQKLIIASRRRGKSLSHVVENYVNKGLAAEEKTQIEKMYAALDALKGVAKGLPADTSSTIDEILYGEQGAWRGTMPSNKKQG